MIKKPKVDHLLGLEFEHGVQDCYSMLQNVYMDCLGIKLNDYARPNDWWLTDKNLYVNNFKNEGFQLLDDISLDKLRPYDVFLIALPDPRSEGETPANHCAVYLGEGEVIHHRLGKLSEIKKYTGMLRNFTTHIIRHKDVNLDKVVVQKVNIMDHILPSKRALLEQAMKEHDAGTE
jgi:cell wall-associated NlpC family hydrolase